MGLFFNFFFPSSLLGLIWFPLFHRSRTTLMFFLSWYDICSPAVHATHIIRVIEAPPAVQSAALPHIAPWLTEVAKGDERLETTPGFWPYD